MATTTKRSPRKSLAAENEDPGFGEVIVHGAQTARDTVASMLPDTGDLVNRLEEQLTEAREKIRELTERVNTAAQTAKENTSAAIASAGETISSTASAVADRATAAAQTAAHHADAVGSDVERFSRRNPIGALSAAVAFGLLIGLATRRKR